jgi:hypothetical protein
MKEIKFWLTGLSIVLLKEDPLRLKPLRGNDFHVAPAVHFAPMASASMQLDYLYSSGRVLRSSCSWCGSFTRVLLALIPKT